MALLSARGLTCGYRRRPEPTLRGVDLELRAGEVTLVCGPSASGKTTLLRALNGLLPRAYPGSTVAGELRIEGVDARGMNLAAIGSRVGTLLQDPARQVVGNDVEKELAFGPENLGLPVDEIRARTAREAARLGLEPLLERSPAELSGGELQKVALAGVLATEPSILLLDEPFAALDPASAHEVAALLRQLADEGRAVLVIEHRIEELANARPDQVLALDDGRATVSSLDAFFEDADPRHLSLPAEVAVRRWRAIGFSRKERHRPDDARSKSRGGGGGGGDGPAVPAPPAAVGDPLLALEDVGFGFRDGAPVLAGAKLRVGAGETVALLGANGAGKSTLLKLAMGLLRPTGGRVVVEGRDAVELTTAELARTAGYLFQDPNAMLFADTVEEECLFAPRNLGVPEAEARERVRDALAKLGLTELAGEAPGGFSIGQKKRVCLAVLVAQGVRVWLFDEPTAGLDPGGVADFLRALRSGRGAEDAVVFATHDLDLALLHATGVALVDEGRIVASGPPGEVLADAGRLERARLRSTSLFERNRSRLEAGLPPLDARALAALAEDAP